VSSNGERGPQAAHPSFPWDLALSPKTRNRLGSLPGNTSSGRQRCSSFNCRAKLSKDEGRGLSDVSSTTLIPRGTIKFESSSSKPPVHRAIQPPSCAQALDTVPPAFWDKQRSSGRQTKLLYCSTCQQTVPGCGLRGRVHPSLLRGVRRADTSKSNRNVPESLLSRRIVMPLTPPDTIL
jgi:hypothetical protein